MIKRVELLYLELQQQLRQYEHEPIAPLRYIEQGFIAVQQKFTQLNQLLDGHIFANDAEEIFFFRHLQPKFRGCLEYFALAYGAEIAAAAAPDKKDFWEEEAAMCRKFFIKHEALYDYYRSDKQDEDERYFLLKNKLFTLDLMTDDLESTPQSVLLGKFIAREMYLEYIEKRLHAG